MLTAARRECCTPGDAHGRRLGVLLTILPPRPGRRTHCAGTGGVATLPRAVPRNVLRFPALWRAPRSGLLASPQHPVQHIVVSFRRPKHLFHMRAATGALSTNPATAPPPAKLFCSVRTITLESAAERARRALAPSTDTHFFGRQRRRETPQCGSASRSRSASSLERAAERPRSVLASPAPCTRP
jgi:hypothetical protein